jgi:hypothetical protein
MQTSTLASKKKGLDGYWDLAWEGLLDWTTLGGKRKSIT